jgi:hypothetical protein
MHGLKKFQREGEKEWGVVPQWSERGLKELAVDLIYFRVC